MGITIARMVYNILKKQKEHSRSFCSLYNYASGSLQTSSHSMAFEYL